MLLFLVDLSGQTVQPFLFPLDFELGDGQVFFGAATLAALHIRVSGVVHVVEENRLAGHCMTSSGLACRLLQDGLS